jgi:hypothetical protein
MEMAIRNETRLNGRKLNISIEVIVIHHRVKSEDNLFAFILRFNNMLRLIFKNKND